ncbi:MAG: prolyl oligopeptidase family serine peptidase, partial [Acidimicrobiales bacterium]
ATPSTAVAACGQGSWVAGTVDLCDGELVYRDYVYDDHGATLTPQFAGPFEGLYAFRPGFLDAYGQHPPMGAADLPLRLVPGVVPESRDNTADLVGLRLRVDGDALQVSAELNTMFDPGRTVVVVGIDTDDDLSTVAGSSWPGGILASDFVVPTPLANRGLDTFVTLAGGDPDTNRLTATVPRPPGDRWRLQAVTARPIFGSPGPVAMNVAFRGPIERGGWWEHAQSIALAENDLSAFAQTVDVADLTSGVTRPAEVEPGFVYQRVYISEFPVGEGVANPGAPGPGMYPAIPVGVPNGQAFAMMGRYQPYGFYLPPGEAPFGVQLALHGFGENHATMLWDQATFENPPNFATRFGEEQNRIIAAPLGRGFRGFYSGHSERDVLDVLADVQASYAVDPDRVFISGLSMGGYGAMRIAALHPDLFAGVVQWVGYTGDLLNGTPLAGSGSTDIGALGNTVELLGNLRHVPMGATYSTEDELVHVNQALAVRARLAELQLPSRFWLHPVGNHGIDYVLNDWSNEAAWSADRTRVQDPPHVTFRTDERFYAADIGVTPDRAYWASAIVPAGSGSADVDAVSHGCGVGDPIMRTTDLQGNEPIPWLAQDIDIIGETARPAANRLELTLANVASLTIDTGDPDAAVGGRGACLGAEEIDYRIVTDRATTVTFDDGRALPLTAGAHEGVLAAAGASAAVATAVHPSAGPAVRERALPATGAAAPPWALPMLAAGLVGFALIRRRRTA